MPGERLASIKSDGSHSFLILLGGTNKRIKCFKHHAEHERFVDSAEPKTIIEDIVSVLFNCVS